MYYGKKKLIIIIVSVVIGVLVLGGILLFLFLGTDIFKSNKALFWKYATNMSTDRASLSTSQLEDIEKMMQQQPYKLTGKLTGNLEQNSQEIDLGEASITGEVDSTSNYAHINANYQYKAEKILDIDFVKTPENSSSNTNQTTNNTTTNTITNTTNIEENPITVYALKSEDIVTAYLGIRNDNLKVFAQKLGLDSNAIPNKIDTSETQNSYASYSDLFKISDGELQHISEVYGKIITDYIPDANYKKTTESPIEVDGKVYKATAYRLDLSGTEIKELLLKILTRMQTDNTMLNLISSKLSILGYDTSEYSPDYFIKNFVDRINNVSEFPDISVVVYNNDGINVATEIIVKNNTKITFSINKNRFNIKFEDLNNSDSDTISITGQYKFTSTLSQINLSMKKEYDTLYDLSFSNEGSASEGKVTTKVEISNESVNIKYNQEIEFLDEITNKVKLDQTNCFVLNDLAKDQLENLLKQISDRINYVVQEKSQLLRSKMQTSTQSSVADVISNSVDDLDRRMVEMYNDRFKAYEGENRTAAQVKTLKLTVESNNSSADSDNIITMYLNNEEVKEDTKIDSKSTYNIKMEYGTTGFVSKILVTTVQSNT